MSLGKGTREISITPSDPLQPRASFLDGMLIVLNSAEIMVLLNEGDVAIPLNRTLMMIDV